MFPLHLAALNAHSECCRKLLSSGNTQLSELEVHISSEMECVLVLFSLSASSSGFSLWPFSPFHSPKKRTPPPAAPTSFPANDYHSIRIIPFVTVSSVCAAKKKQSSRSCGVSHVFYVCCEVIV